MSQAPTLIWLRQDLRLADHPALAAATAPAVVAFVLDPDGPWQPGSAARWWLHHSLAALATDVACRGGRLILLKGSAVEEIPRLAQALGAQAVYWNRHWEPGEPARETALADRLRDLGIATRAFSADLLFEPGMVRTKDGTPFRVFTPFWRAALTLPPPPPPLPAPNILAAPPAHCANEVALGDLALLPTIAWYQGMAASWTPGEAGAKARLARFLDQSLTGYAAERDFPHRPATSMLSPHLAFGEISPRQIWHAVHSYPPGTGADTFLKEMGWREFSHSLMAAHPTLTHQPLAREFQSFPWADDPAAMRAWTQGQTGYPIVDAGMRQLWHTGWMHNRVRMIVGSFLVKDLLLPWQQGERWFHDTLVDANVANNAASWQWIAGCGADAAPYFRVFNPVLQGQKFDPNGQYVRQWLPELADLPDQFIHRPWEAPPVILAGAGIRLGRTYPAPLVDHAEARKRALAAYQSIKAAPLIGP